jgi:hypothetical protein
MVAPIIDYFNGNLWIPIACPTVTHDGDEPLKKVAPCTLLLVFFCLDLIIVLTTKLKINCLKKIVLYAHLKKMLNF